MADKTPIECTDAKNDWWNYKQAGDLPPDAVERMWRALDAIAERAKIRQPGHIDFLSKAKIAAMAEAALPSGGGTPNG